MSNLDKAQNKLTKLGVTLADLEFCLSLISFGKIKKTYEYLSQKYGNEFIIKLNHFMNDDFENIKMVSYDEMKSLSELIKSDSAIDTFIIATGKYINSVFPGPNGEMFDPYLTKKALEYCKINQKHMRYHALFDYFQLELFISDYINLNGRTIDELTPAEIAILKEHKKEILAKLKWYVQESLNFIEQNNVRLSDGTMLINEVEVFNELVEKNKKDKQSPYEIIWEKYFGITISDIMTCFPKDQTGRFRKPTGTSFVYNETTLTESTEKIKKVESLLYQIDKIDPDFISIVGDQMHLSDEDIVSSIGYNNLIATAKMLKRIQDGRIMVNGEIKTIKPKLTECTEHDFHFTKYIIEVAKKSGIDLWNLKKGMQEVIENVYNGNGVNFQRSTYWSIFGKNDHNLCRANVKNSREGLPLIDTMYAGLIKDGETFTSLTSLEKSQENLTNLNKPLARVLTKENNGFSNALIITFVTIIIAIIIAIILV